MALMQNLLYFGKLSDHFFLDIIFLQHTPIPFLTENTLIKHTIIYLDIFEEQHSPERPYFFTYAENGKFFVLWSMNNF